MNFLISAEEDSNLLLSFEGSASPILLDVFPQAPVFVNNGTVISPSAVVLSAAAPTAGVSGGRLVGIDNELVILVDSSIVSTALQAVGITKAAAAPSTSVEYVTSGLITDSAWNWLSGPIYAGLNGGLVQTAPISGFVLEIGKALSPTQILVDFKSPLILS
jgi:hypothetical protein